MRGFWVCVAAVTALGCDSDGPSSLAFEFREPAGVMGEFRNGDIALYLGARVHRMQLNFTAAPELLPGIDCNWLLPAADGTEFVECTHYYSRTPGQAWQRLLMPDTPATFVGQSNDGTRYFRAKDSQALLAQAPAATTFAPVANVAAEAMLEVSPYGDFLVRVTGGFAALMNGQPGPTLPLPAYPLSATRPSFALGTIVDASGHSYIAKEQWAFDRYDLKTGAHDDDWFPAINGDNPSFRFMGVSSDGELFAMSEVNQGLSQGQKNNKIAIGSLMKRGKGAAGWQQVDPLFGTNYLFYEQHPQFRPGLDGTWFFSTCIANCAGINGQSQFEVRRWQPSGEAELPALPNAYQATKDVVFGIAMGITLDTSSCENAPGGDLFAVRYVVCHELGTFKATRVTQTGTSTVSIKVVAPPTLPVRKHRHTTLIDFSSSGWHFVGTDGLLHQAAWTVPSAPETVLASPTGVIAVTLARQTTTLLTADGGVYQVQPGAPLTATRLNVPPAQAIHGSYMVGRDGNVYPTIDGATALADMHDVVSINCRATYLTNGALHEFCGALSSTGHFWAFEKLQGSPVVVRDGGDAPLVGGINNGGAISRDGHLLEYANQTTATTAFLGDHTLIDFSGIVRTGYQSGTGNFNVPSVAMVTQQGEAWLSAFAGANNYGIRLPAGRTAIAIEPTLQGVVVWLDDQSLIYASILSVQMTGGPGGVDATALPYRVATPSF